MHEKLYVINHLSIACLNVMTSTATEGENCNNMFNSARASHLKFPNEVFYGLRKLTRIFFFFVFLKLEALPMLSTPEEKSAVFDALRARIHLPV